MKGRWITASVGVALIYAGVHVALIAPPLSGVPLIGTPLLFLAGAALIVRLMRTA